MIFTKLKIYLTAAVVAVLGALGAALKIRTAQYKKQKKKATAATEHADHLGQVIRHDADVDIQVDKHLADVANGEDDELTNPNDWD